MSQIDTIRLLIINDDANEVERLLSMLRNSGRTTRPQHVPSIEGLEKLLGDQAWDLLLAVDTAKSCDAKTALRTIKKLDKDIPAIFLSECDPDEFNMALIDGLKAGARDVVILDDDQHLLMTMARELGNLVERRERRAADRKLLAAEKRCQQLLDSSRDAIAYVEDGMFLYANQSFAELFGYKDIDDIIAMPVIDIISSADQDKYKQFMKAFKLSEEGEQALQLTGVRNNGGSFSMDIAVTHAIHENDPCIQLLVAAKVGLDSAAVEAEIKKVSSIDPLTGIYNRVYMSNAINQAIRNASEQDKYNSLHIISIDLYDHLRTTLGVSGRDAAVADLAKFIKGNIDGNTILGRVADDEFALLTNNTEEEQQVSLARNLCKQIADHICQAAGKTAQVTVSIGICPITEKITSPDQVMDRAHAACKEVLTAGKNGSGNDAKYFTAKLSDTAEIDDSLVTEVVENALKRDGFTLKFQPFISLQGDTTEHYEALLHLTPDENGKTLTADEMFQVIGRHDELGKKIDRWTILTAAKKLAAHHAADHDTNLLLNITAATLRDEGFPAWLGIALKTANLTPRTIIIQFSEADAGNYLTQAKTFCLAMQSMNIRCSIKHFGCSLDPFKTLSHLDADVIKIDGSFASDIQHKGEKPDTLKELITKLNEAKKVSIVPHVENATMMATLWQSGTHFIQGNYVQAPSDKMDFVFSDE
ncbi:MAG: EAL domain-containing protein [Pseudomonadales bacterium]|nr:EAL domain-containing protein [Pseudomonadales bacterium]